MAAHNALFSGALHIGWTSTEAHRDRFRPINRDALKQSAFNFVSILVDPAQRCKSIRGQNVQDRPEGRGQRPTSLD
jgi:hypothetical protein